MKLLYLKDDTNVSRETISDYQELWKFAMDDIFDKVVSNLKYNKVLQEIIYFQPKFRKYLISDKIVTKNHVRQREKNQNILLVREYLVLDRRQPAYGCEPRPEREGSRYTHLCLVLREGTSGRKLVPRAALWQSKSCVKEEWV